MDEKKDVEKKTPKRLCLNCAWRAACAKRFSVSYANGEVICLDYSFDVALKEKNE